MKSVGAITLSLLLIAVIAPHVFDANQSPSARAESLSGGNHDEPAFLSPREANRWTYLPYVSAMPTPTPRPAPCTTTPLPPVDWDPRLGPGTTLSGLENVRIVPATVAQCQRFWRTVVVHFEDYYESGGNHNIYVKVVDENGNRVNGTSLHVTSYVLSEYPEEKPATDLCDCNFNTPIYYPDSYNVQIQDVLPSDMVAGMILPLKQHVNYRITFQRVLNPAQ